MEIDNTIMHEGMTHKAYRIIKNMIIKNELKNGHKITEMELMDKLSMSRTPIREAILRLSYEGFIIIHPRKCIEVVSITPSMIRSIFELRMLIEPNILRANAENLSKEKLKEIKTIFLNYNNCLNCKENDYIHELINLDYKFHSYLINISNNEYSRLLMEKLFDYATMIRFSTRVHEYRYLESCLEHIKIIDLILDDKIDEASEELHRHIEICYREAIQQFLNS